MEGALLYDVWNKWKGHCCITCGDDGREDKARTGIDDRCGGVRGMGAKRGGEGETGFGDGSATTVVGKEGKLKIYEQYRRQFHRNWI